MVDLVYRFGTRVLKWSMGKYFNITAELEIPLFRITLPKQFTIAFRKSHFLLPGPKFFTF